MRLEQTHSNATAMLCIYTLVVGTIATLYLLSFHISISDLASFSDRYIMGTLALLCIVTVGASIFSISHITARAKSVVKHLLTIANIATACILLFQMETYASQLADEQVNPLFAAPYYWYWLGQSILTFCLSYIMTSFLQLKGRWPLNLALVNAGIVLAAGSFGLFVKSWLPSDNMAQYFSLLSSALLSLIPIQVIVLFTFWPAFRTTSHSLREMIALRLKPQDQNRNEINTAGLLIVGQVAQLLAYAYTMHVSQGDILEYPVQVLSFLWFPTYAYLYHEHTKDLQSQRERFLASSLTSSSAKRFLLRHATINDSWAATVGMRTPSFLINHDPNGAVAQSLPASLQQIRSREIQNVVNNVLSHTQLCNRVVGSQIFGTIDSESSLRPCVDVLSLFSCLYLDAIPLIERRLRGLARLLPILDPNLGAIFKPDDIDKLSTRNLWLFHFDYDWTDQLIVRTAQGTRYGVQMQDLPSTVKITVFEYLKKRNQLGNFVWIGEKARTRLMQEAPMLTNIIQAWPVPVGEKDEEILVFLIKFEELIPRLQRYYNLDARQSILKDFNSSEESKRFINIVDLRLNNANNLQDIFEILDALVSYPWRGFKEKDDALRAISRSFTIAHELLAKQGVPENRKDDVTAALRKRFTDAIFAIGYPSQLVHIAQQDKMSMRQPETIIKNAGDPWSPRFQESWLLMATMDPERYSLNELDSFLTFLGTAPENKHLKTKALVVCKAIEALSNIAQHIKSDPDNRREKIVNRYANWLIELQAPADMFILFLDTFLFLETNFPITFDETTTARLEEYFLHLSNKMGKASPEVTAIYDRWQREETAAA